MQTARPTRKLPRPDPSVAPRPSFLPFPVTRAFSAPDLVEKISEQFEKVDNRDDGSEKGKERKEASERRRWAKGRKERKKREQGKKEALDRTRRDDGSLKTRSVGTGRQSRPEGYR